MTDAVTLQGIKNYLATTLQTAVAKVGPMPNACRDEVMAVFAGDDAAAMCALGYYLEECIKTGSYDRLIGYFENLGVKPKAVREVTA